MWKVLGIVMGGFALLGFVVGDSKSALGGAIVGYFAFWIMLAIFVKLFPEPDTPSDPSEDEISHSSDHDDYVCGECGQRGCHCG